jgi:hypothetical protein
LGKIFLLLYVMAAPLFFFKGIFFAFLNVETLFRRSRRDAVAARVWKRLQENKPPCNYILYLRPFFVTNRLSPIAHTQSFFDELDNFPDPSEVRDLGDSIDLLRDYGIADIEAVIGHAASPWGTIIALGRPKEAIGAARIGWARSHPG